MAEKIGAANVHCADRGQDRYGRTLAICTLGDLDLNGWMVSEGWALAYRRYSLEYVLEEDVARAADIGKALTGWRRGWDGGGLTCRTRPVNDARGPGARTAHHRPA